jgi:formate dehydrogenase maturation protein FdhE
MADVEPLTASATIEAIERLVIEGKDETSTAAKGLLEAYRAGECETRWQALCAAIQVVAGRTPGLDASASRITIAGETTKFCPFCGGELPKHRVTP